MKKFTIEIICEGAAFESDDMEKNWQAEALACGQILGNVTDKLRNLTFTRIEGQPLTLLNRNGNVCGEAAFSGR